MLPRVRVLSVIPQSAEVILLDSLGYLKKNKDDYYGHLTSIWNHQRCKRCVCVKHLTLACSRVSETSDLCGQLRSCIHIHTDYINITENNKTDLNERRK